jgi:hypothetical protein
MRDLCLTACIYLLVSMLPSPLKVISSPVLLLVYVDWCLYSMAWHTRLVVFPDTAAVGVLLLEPMPWFVLAL